MTKDLIKMSTGKAFTNPSAAKIDQQRKILEELEKQKKQIKTSNSGSNISDQSSMLPGMQSASSTGAPNNTPNTQAPSSGGGGSVSVPQTLALSTNMQDNIQANQQMSSNQRKALEEANKTSFGYFITQDSSFGNLILPVIPRIPPQPTTVSNTPAPTINTS